MGRQIGKGEKKDERREASRGEANDPDLSGKRKGDESDVGYLI